MKHLLQSLLTKETRAEALLKCKDMKGRNRRRQTCFIWCKKCSNELIGSNSYVTDNDGFVTYTCKKCGTTAVYDFIHYPIPCIVDDRPDAIRYYEEDELECESN